MVHAKAEGRLVAQLRTMLAMAGARPSRWIFSTVVVSLALAALDTLGVAAMIPLTQLATGGEPDDPLTDWLGSLVGTTDPVELVPVVAAFVAMVFILKSVASILFRWWLLGRTTLVSALSSAELARRYALAPYADHRARRLSEVYRNVNDATTQSASVLLGILSICTDLVVLIAISVVLAITSPFVTLIAVTLFGAFVLGVQGVLRRRQYRVGEEMAEAGLEAWQFLIPTLDGFREARLSSSGGSLVEGFRRARMRRARAARVMGILSDAPRYLLEIGFVLAIMAASAYLFATTTPAAALTVLGVFAAASLRALPTLNRISANLTTVRTGRPGLDIFIRAADELAAGGTHDEMPRGGEGFTGDILLQDLRYRYPDTEDFVLDGITLRIAENRTTAFVGASGAGKSTLMDLVLGLLEPTSGSIECGGRPPSDDLAGWYAQIGVVPQDVFLLNDTLIANIAFGVAPDRVDTDRVRKVLEMARMTEFVAALPDGLDTIVGERGTRLSGGQRQRIGLARALYREPRILVLDEATSALDNLTEHEIAATLATLRGSMTILIVAHRLSTVRNADTLVFLKAGAIESLGSFEQVIEGSPDFARLVELGSLD
ncbi:ABC transporter ATP-binding protein [Agromyces sp. GXS1127]|uniref:ABC transporter ATP-binding protein n=1 Tax=Agromyces sp. GXS1127 TaxID=3424181 RepID=UPI003D3107BA